MPIRLLPILGSLLITVLYSCSSGRTVSAIGPGEQHPIANEGGEWSAIVFRGESFQPKVAEMKTAVVQLETMRYQAEKIAERYGGLEDEVRQKAVANYDTWASIKQVPDPDEGRETIEDADISDLIGEDTANSIHQKTEHWESMVDESEAHRDQVARILLKHGIQSFLYLKTQGGYKEYQLGRAD